MEGGVGRLGNADHIYWLEPFSAARNCWHLDPRCNGFRNHESRVVEHRACLFCTYGVVETPSRG